MFPEKTKYCRLDFFEEGLTFGGKGVFLPRMMRRLGIQHLDIALGHGGNKIEIQKIISTF